MVTRLSGYGVSNPERHSFVTNKSGVAGRSPLAGWFSGSMVIWVWTDSTCITCLVKKCFKKPSIPLTHEAFGKLCNKLFFTITPHVKANRHNPDLLHQENFDLILSRTLRFQMCVWVCRHRPTTTHTKLFTWHSEYEWQGMNPTKRKNPFASVNWNDEREIRIFSLNPQHKWTSSGHHTSFLCSDCWVFNYSDIIPIWIA